MIVSEVVKNLSVNGDAVDEWRKRREDTISAMTVAKLFAEVERIVDWRRGAMRGSSWIAVRASFWIWRHVSFSELVMMVVGAGGIFFVGANVVLVMELSCCRFPQLLSFLSSLINIGITIYESFSSLLKSGSPRHVTAGFDAVMRKNLHITETLRSLLFHLCIKSGSHMTWTAGFDTLMRKIRKL